MAVIAAIGPASNVVSSIVSAIFGGMALRAKQATSENEALNQVINAFDQALQQITNAYNHGQLDQSAAQSEVNTLWGWMWQTQTPHIQPNRNGCSSGGNCPRAAMDYESTNGVPNGFCAGTNGASCCVICGPIRLSLERFEAALSKGSGTITVAKVWGDHYGLLTRESYSLTLRQSAIASPLSPVNGVLDQVAQSLGALSGGQQTYVQTEGPSGYPSATVPTTVLPGSAGISSTFLFAIAAIVLLLIGGLLFRGR